MYKRQKRGYLVPVKVGNKNMYAKSDVRRVQTGNKSESEMCIRDSLDSGNLFFQIVFGVINVSLYIGNDLVQPFCSVTVSPAGCVRFPRGAGA